MTPSELRALGERWKACPGFRWRPGMACEWKCSGGAGAAVIMRTFATVADLSWPLSLDYGVMHSSEVPQDAWPLLSCPCTRGALLEDVREAWGDPWVVAVPFTDDEDVEQWGLTITNGPEFREFSEIEALISALEAAPALEEE